MRGDGACEAITDAGSLVAGLRECDDVSTALLAYDRERREPAQKIAKRSRQVMRISQARGAGAAVRNGVVRTVGLVVR